MSNLLSVLDVVDALPGAAELRRRSYELLGDVRGRVVVDVGSGGGRAAAELGELGARAVGIDADPEMVAVAAGRWGGVEFQVGDARVLPFEDGSVGGYRADKVLHILDEPLDALVEARRVLAEGALAVLIGQDWDTIVVESALPEVTRRIVRAKADSFPSPRAARGYRNLLLDAGFSDPVVEVHTFVFTDETAIAVMSRLTNIENEPVEEWLAEQRERLARDRTFLALPMFVAAARR